MSGILSKALAGLGKGMVEVGRDRAEQANWEKRQQIQMQGQKDMEVWRQQMAEELRQKMGNQVKTRAQELMAGDPKMTIEKATAMAGGEAMGKFDTGYGIQKDELDFAERKRVNDANIGNIGADNARAGAAERRAQEKHTLEMGEAKTKKDYLDKYRSAVLDGDTESAKKFAALLGMDKQEQNRFESRVLDDGLAVLDKQTGHTSYKTGADLRKSSGVGAQRSSVFPQNAGLPRPKTEAEVAALQKGSRFIAPDGRIMIK